ncbi:MAG: DUF2961 domain-containing protein [Phycisphaerae bacterium]|jgi:hypothetical protein
MHHRRLIRGFLTCLVAWSSSAAARADGLDDLFRLREARTRRVSSADPNWRDGNGDCRGIEPGQTLTIADVQGPGIIRHIWFTIAADDPEYGRSLSLRMYWDGAEQPAVETPIGDFFTIGHGRLQPMTSLPVAVSSEGRALNCYWPMPFGRSAKITVTNDSKQYRVGCVYWYVDYEEVDALPADAAYFHAQYRQEYPATMGQDYLILDAVGRGHYVGTVLSSVARTASWFGEGDDRFFIDGAEEPQLRGTGTEDYFCDAWGFRQFNQPFYGVPVWDGYEVGDRVSAYRWHINDPVHFRKSLKVTIEHKGVMFDQAGKVISGFMERPDLFSSVAFWYQTGRAKRFAELPPAEQRVVPRRVIELEGLAKDARPAPSNTPVEPQDGGYSAGKHLWARFAEDGGTLTVPIKLDKPLAGIARLKLTRSWDYGTWRITLNGRTLPGAERVDLYSATIVPLELKVGAIDLPAGTHELKFECLGRNAASAGYFLGADVITVSEVTPYTTEKK